MNRVSTAYAFQNGAADFLRAQGKQVEANRQLADGKRATDLKGFGRQSETLIAAKAVQARAAGFAEMHNIIGGRLDAQGLALESVAGSADDARQLVLSAVSSGRGDSLMPMLNSILGTAADALNWKHEGRYLFAGSLVDVPPVDITNLADLMVAPTVDEAFENDQTPSVSRLNETTSIQTGFLADEVGAELFRVLRSIQVFHAATPINGVLNEDQITFLKTKVAELETAHEGLLGKVAENGLSQQRVDDAQLTQLRRVDNLRVFIADTSEIDFAEASVKLEAAQLAVQASARAIQTLRESSLLNFLPL